eukprot:SAG31_NODE_17875_length_655_cov_0.886691_1_plen_81_part_10
MAATLAAAVMESEEADREHQLLTLMSEENSRHLVPKAAAVRESSLISSLLEDQNEDHTSNQLAVPLSAAACEAFTPFLLQQ